MKRKIVRRVGEGEAPAEPCLCRTRRLGWSLALPLLMMLLCNWSLGGELILGGFDPSSRETYEKSARSLEEAMPKFKQVGATSHEVYVRWNLCEVEPGKWDWTVYDRYFEIYKKNGIKCVPFLICGSPYSLPDWYYKKPGSQGYVCLEHHEESDVQSLWNPEMRRHVSEFIKAFCDHYRDTGLIEAMLLGVTGNYGEAIYVASGNDWTAGVHGKYHTHGGFWAGDPFAVKSFREWLKKKYETNQKLSAAWGGKAVTLESVQPFLKKDAANDRAWIDFVDWYTESMTEYASFWLKETRKHLPNAGIYLCTGGHAPPEHGADFGEQCRIAAEVNGGVRITNEASDYRINFPVTRWVASAGHQYGAYFSFEPAGGVDANGVITRIYNATASGARGLHYYFPNLFDHPEATENFLNWRPMLKPRQPVVEIAVYYPSTDIKLHGSNPFLNAVRPLRDRFDFAYMSDKQILDGGLKNIKALVIMYGETLESSVVKEVQQWLHSGGGFVIPTGVSGVKTVEGEPVPECGPANSSRDFDAVCTKLLQANSLSPITLAMVKLDGKEDGLFVTATSPTELLWLNSTDKEATVGDTRLPPHSIIEQTIPPQ